LVERYAGVVYHTALRQTSDSHASEEVAQVVFIALAQKAGSISRRATVCGWLFRATRLAVLNQARKNSNRRRREQEALVMQTASDPNETQSVWEQIAPHLNEALEKLSETDRDLVMLRFFAEKSYKDLAGSLGVSEETARKRISRAIDRLRGILGGRGLKVSSLALAAAFAAHGVKAAPPGIAASWASAAVANVAMGAAPVPTSGIQILAAAAKIAGIAALAVLGVVTYCRLGSVSENKPSVATVSQALPSADASTPAPVPSKSPDDSQTNVVSAAALARVEAALHDTNETKLYPNTVMQEAIDGLSAGKKAAVPMLESAMNDSDLQVRERAIDGLGMIGPEAKEAAPLLLNMLRTGGLSSDFAWTTYQMTFQEIRSGKSVPSGEVGIEANNLILYSLGLIHPSPQILPELARMIRENTNACRIISAAFNNFRSRRQSVLDGSWLWDIADGNSAILNDALTPLLQDPRPDVRRTAATALIYALGDEADPRVFPVVLELLKSGDDSILRLHGLMLLYHAGADLSGTKEIAPYTGDGGRPRPRINASRLGKYLNDTVSALAEVARMTSREDLRLWASRILDVLSPDFRKDNPHRAAELEQEDETQAFTFKINTGQITIPEMLEGIKKFPKAAPAAGEYLVRRGSNSVAALPALAEALAALAPAPDSSGMDRANAIPTRERLANAMQKIAPDRPKPIFTYSDVTDLHKILFEPEMRADPDRRAKVSAARKLAEWPTHGPFDVSPEQVRRLLAAIKEADAPTYNALVAKVNEIDPHFSENPPQ
jgi:RNA polymerase sigma factor (sigma-70 family)